MYEKYENYPEAIRSINIALNLSQKAKSFSKIALSHFTLAELYAKIGKNTKALESAKKSLEVCEKHSIEKTEFLVKRINYFVENLNKK